LSNKTAKYFRRFQWTYPEIFHRKVFKILIGWKTRTVYENSYMLVNSLFSLQQIC